MNSGIIHDTGRTERVIDGEPQLLCCLQINRRHRCEGEGGPGIRFGCRCREPRSWVIMCRQRILAPLLHITALRCKWRSVPQSKDADLRLPLVVFPEYYHFQAGAFLEGALSLKRLHFVSAQRWDDAQHRYGNDLGAVRGLCHFPPERVTIVMIGGHPLLYLAPDVFPATGYSDR